MADRTPPPTNSPRPWWKRGWGIAYLTLLGLASAATIVLAAVPVPSGEAGLGTSIVKAVGLRWAVVTLDVLLAIAIAVGVFRRRFWRLPRAPATNLFIGLILLALAMFGVY